MEFLNALRGAKNTIGAIDSRLNKLRAERAAVAAAAPHIDDLQAWALRGLNSASEDFLGRLKRWHFKDAALTGWTGETLDSHAGPQLLGIHDSVPHGAGPAVGGGAADVAALTHFLKPAIAAQLPKLIEEAFPGSRKGLRSSERVAKLAKLDGQIGALEAERAAYANGLRDAQRAIDVPANTLSTDDREAAEAVAAGLVENVI
jgi:hypothetical protein